MTNATNQATKEPITVGGWYEHTDGTWGEYKWIDGSLCCSRVAAQPETAEERADRYVRESDEQIRAELARSTG